MIRIDAIWLAAEPIDMHVGMDTALARVVKVFGAARPHHAYLFTNRRSNRIKVLVYDGFGIWLAQRRLNRGRFVWADDGTGAIGLKLLDDHPGTMGLAHQGRGLATAERTGTSTLAGVIHSSTRHKNSEIPFFLIVNVSESR